MYFSGASFSNLLGLPDLGVTTLSEITDAVSKITSKVDLPLIVDADTGFGEAVNVSRTVNELERVALPQFTSRIRLCRRGVVIFREKRSFRQKKW